MTNSLSQKEAESVADIMLPLVRKKIKKSKEEYGFGQADTSIADIANLSPAVKREGSTSDVYCKIAEAMYNRGIATDIKTRDSELLFRFREIRDQYDKRPSPEHCTTMWNTIQKMIKKNKI